MRFALICCLLCAGVARAQMPAGWGEVETLKRGTHVIVETAAPTNFVRCRLERVDATMLECMPEVPHASKLTFLATGVETVYRLPRSWVGPALLVGGTLTLLGLAVTGNDAAGVLLIGEGFAAFFYYVGQGVKRLVFGPDHDPLPAGEKRVVVYRRVTQPAVVGSASTP